MTILIIVVAFAPAGVFFALRAYLKVHPPDSSEAGIRGLQRGLKLGVASLTALPLFYIVIYLHPPGFLGNLPYFVSAVAGNGVNLAGIIYCLSELSGESLFAAFLLLLVQLLWMWTALGALMAGNGF
jgi:hypothetical protein